LNIQTSWLAAAPFAAISTETNAKPKSTEGQKLATQISQRRNEADVLIQRSEERFQRGKKFYQEKDAAAARKEFDAAVDLMLEASELAPDRAAWEKRFDTMVDAVHRYDLAGLGAAMEPAEAAFEKAPLEEILEMTFPTDPKLKLQVRDQLMATVSQLPLAVNDQVLGYIRYFSSPRGRATVLAGLRRAGRYRPLIQRILDEEGLPQELIHLAQAESGFLPRAMSSKAAGGMWQFVRYRGREYGLHQTSLIDERFDPEKSTRAAARHLRDLYREFGDWYLAIAAYNCGPGAVAKAVQRSGYADFWELRARRLLPTETTNYVPIILALTIMAKNPAAYDLTDIVAEDPIQYDTLELTSETNLALIGDLTDTPVSELMELNPAILKKVAPEGYSLRVPRGSGTALMASLQLVPPERRASWRMHKVQPGETLAAIGKKYGAAPTTILAANQMASADPVEGDRLVIPAIERAAPARRSLRSRNTAHANRASHSVRASQARRSPARPAAAKPAPRSPRVLTRTASIPRREAAY
jgi:membrane-bound lytic murein transglycosylase D